MRYKEIQIRYWTDTDGTDFQQMDEFVEGINHEYFLTVTKKRSDAAGGGIYDFVIKIIENTSLLDLAQSYFEDGVKILIGFSLKSILTGAKKLFKSNEIQDPAIEKVSLDFKDSEIILYEIYHNSLDENLDKIMIKLFELRFNNKSLFLEPIAIHIPIFNHIDSYNLCDFRVKLDVDEPITHFENIDYFNFWGIKTKDNYFVYSVVDGKLEEKMFYTQKRYNKLFRNFHNISD